MSEQDIKDAEFVDKLRGWMVYPILFLNALLDKLLMSLFILVLAILVLVFGGLAFQLYSDTAISYSIDLIPLAR